MAKLYDLISPAPLEKCGNRTFPVLSMTMHDGIVLQSERFKKSLVSADQSPYKVVKRNQLVVGFPIDEGVLYIQKVIDEGIMSPAYDIWDVDQEKTDLDYLELCLHSPQSLQYYKTNLRGTTARRRSLPKDVLLSLPIPLPSMSQQKRIVDTIKHINTIIELKKRELLQFDNLIKAQFVEMFGDPVANNLGWPQTTLCQITSKIGSGATPKGGKESYQTEGISLIRSMNVHDGRFEYKDLAHITDEQAEQLNNVIVKENDVFINITGASVARSCIVPIDVLPARVNQHVSIVRCIKNQIHPIFANNMFLNDRFKGQLLDIGESGGATRQAITKQQLERLNVILPPMNLQEQFATLVSAIDKSKSVVQQALAKDQLLFDSLMQKYFG